MDSVFVSNPIFYRQSDFELKAYLNGKRLLLYPLQIIFDTRLTITAPLPAEYDSYLQALSKEKGSQLISIRLFIPSSRNDLSRACDENRKVIHTRETSFRVSEPTYTPYCKLSSTGTGEAVCDAIVYHQWERKATTYDTAFLPVVMDKADE